MSDRAIILAGGQGTRLQPYTLSMPKPLVPIDDMPVIEIIVKQLARDGFGHITVALNHQADAIRSFLGAGELWGVRIDYTMERDPLGTAAPLRLVPDLPQHFLFMNGDVLTDLDFRRVYDSHVRANRLLTITATLRETALDYGVLHADENSHVTGFAEKPVLANLVCMGINVGSRDLIAEIPVNQRYGFDDLVSALIAQGKTIQIEQHDGYWRDIGRAEDYLQVTREFSQWRSHLVP